MFSPTVPVNRKFCWTTIPSWRCSESAVMSRISYSSINSRPALGQVELGDQVDDGGLAAARVADQRNRLTRLGREIDVAKHGPLGVVREPHVLELDAALHPRQLDRVGPVGPFGRTIE